MSAPAPEIYDKAGRRVAVDGRVWTVWSADHCLDLAWSRLDRLPGYVLEAAMDYVRHMIETQSVSSVDGMFRVLLLLAGCAELQKANRVSEAVFAEFRDAAGQNLVAVHRYRGFYLWAVRNGYEGFGEDVLEEIYSSRIGQTKTPSPLKGRCPPFTAPELEWIEGALDRAPKDLLSTSERLVMVLHLVHGSNPGPIARLRIDDIRLIEDADGTARWFLRVPRHKKRNVHEREASRSRRISDGVARALLAAAQGNAERIRCLGLEGSVAVPIFMRESPRDRFLAEDCPVGDYAMHLSSSEVRALLQRSVNKLCDHEGRPRFNASPRRFRRTRLLFHRLSGMPDEVVADIGDHSSTRIVATYAFMGHHVVKHLDALMGKTFAEIRLTFENAPDPLPRFAGMGIEMLRKSRNFK
jgi:hypothetical protein